MNCPNCGGNNLKVMDTMAGSDNRIFRRRKCANCDNRFRTVEIMDDGSYKFGQDYLDAVLIKSDFYRNANEEPTPEEKERRRAYHKAYREKNRDRINAYAREYNKR